jgi:mRNA-degrading endonuclease RelE of RelBE toxin-antitoxin system
MRADKLISFVHCHACFTVRQRFIPAGIQYNRRMKTVIESSSFEKQVKDWPEALYDALIEWLAANPEAGDVVPESGGLRKIRWARPGMGKRGGYRVIYGIQRETGNPVLLAIYAKSEQENMSPKALRKLQ